MAKLDIDVEGIDRTLRKIKRDLHRGMEKSAEALVKNGKNRAREVISEEEAIFNGEVYAGFRDAETKNTPSTVRVKLYNDVDHAEPLEHGATYGAKGPPIEGLLPWVARQMDWHPDDFDLGDGGIPDSFDGGDDDDSGGSSSHGGSRTTEDNEVRSEEELEDDTTDSGLTHSKQADELSLDSGSIEDAGNRLSRRSLVEISRFQREYSLPKVRSISDKDHETIEGVLEDDSTTIIIPEDLLEYSDYANTYISEYISEKNGDRKFFNVRTNDHDQYVIQHQYGTYLYDNLSDNGLDEFRSRWNFDETDSGFEIPDDADDLSEYATQGERQFFGEMFVHGLRGNYNYRERQKEEYFDDLTGFRDDYFTDSFNSEDTDTLPHPIGYDYSGDREILTEDMLPTSMDEEFTTNFNLSRYLDEDALKAHSNYVVTSDRFDGAKVLNYRNNEKFVDSTQVIEYDRDEVTLQAISKSEAIFNNLEDRDQLILENRDPDSELDYTFAEIRVTPDEIWNREISEGKDVFTDNLVQIDESSIISLREDNPDLWADGIDTIRPVEDSNIEDNFSTNFEDPTGFDVSRTIDEIGHVIVREKSSGNSYRVSRDSPFDKLETIRQTEDGETLSWEWDSTESNEIEVTHLSEKSIEYASIEIDDDILVDPDSAQTDADFTDEVFRATVTDIENGDPVVRPFGVGNTDRRELHSFDSFIASRDNLPGWDSKNWDIGKKVTIERNGRQHTGHLSKTEDPYGDNLSYEANQMGMVDEDGTNRYFTASEVISSEDDGFMDQFYEAPDNIDNSASVWKDWNGDVTEVIRPRDYSPLEGVDDLDVGTTISWDNGSRSGVDEIKIVRKIDGAYYTVDGFDIALDDIQSYEGQGADPNDLKVDQTISTGSSFGEVIEVVDDPDTGEPSGARVDFSGDGEWDDLLDADQMTIVDTDELPDNTEVMFWSHRDGEMKTGELQYMIAGRMYIWGNDGISYEQKSYTLFPITPVAVKFTEDG